jgi:hypothetical protein
MARGKEGKARRKEQRKHKEEDLLEHNFGPSVEEDDDEDAGPVVETVEDDDDDGKVLLPPPRRTAKPRRKTQEQQEEESVGRMDTKYGNRAMKAAMAQTGPKSGIRTTPLILLIIMTGTTLLPALIYASDFLGSYFAKTHVLGSIGYQLGIGQTPRKRVLSFYEKHDPSKVPEVEKIMSKYYGDYPRLIKNLERKYQDYGYFLDWQQDEAPMTIAFEKLAETRDYLGNQFHQHAPQFLKTAVRNVRYNVGGLYKKFRKVWKKTIWPYLEPIVGVPKGAEAQKRKDAKLARDRTGKRRRKNADYRDDIEDEH